MRYYLNLFLTSSFLLVSADDILASSATWGRTMEGLSAQETSSATSSSAASTSRVSASMNIDDDNDNNNNNAFAPVESTAPQSSPSRLTGIKRWREARAEEDLPAKKLHEDPTQCSPVVNGESVILFNPAGKHLDRGIPKGDTSVPTPQTWISKLQQKDTITQLHLVAQIEILQWLDFDPEARHHFLQTCRFYRAFVTPVLGQTHHIPTPLLKNLLMGVLGGKTGDVALFMKDQHLTFQNLSVERLREEIASPYYDGTLSPETKHGQAYRAVEPLSIKDGIFSGPLRIEDEMVLRYDQKLRLVPLNFEGVDAITSLCLNGYQLTIPPAVRGLTNLVYIDLSSNNLTTPPAVTGLPKLGYLSLSSNQLTIPPVVTGLTNLMFLHLEFNQLTTPPVVTGLTHLRELRLDSSLFANEDLLQSVRILNNGRGIRERVSLVAVSRHAQGYVISEDVPLD